MWPIGVNTAGRWEGETIGSGGRHFDAHTIFPSLSGRLAFTLMGQHLPPTHLKQPSVLETLYLPSMGAHRQANNGHFLRETGFVSRHQAKHRPRGVPAKGTPWHKAPPPGLVKKKREKPHPKFSWFKILSHLFSTAQDSREGLVGGAVEWT